MLEQRLQQGSVVIMDGGISTEIQRRGQAMDRDVWSGTAHLADPALVREVHEAYIRAGAEIVIANTFATSRIVLDAAGRGDEFEESNRRAIEVAIAARAAAAARPVWIAGSISPMLPLGDIASPEPRRGTEEDYRQQAEILATAGADLLIAEMMIDLEGAVPLLKGLAAVDLPLWVGFSAARATDGRVIGWRNPDGYMGQAADNDFGDLVTSVLPLGGSVVGVMHSEVDDTGPALAILNQHFEGVTMAYAETGHLTRPNWVFETVATPDDYAEAAAGWVADHGVRIVGGCCGTGPDHIRALSERFG